MQLHGIGPDEAELAAYCDRLNEITEAAGRIKLVQIHTIARAPAEAYVAALSNERVHEIADLVRNRTGLEVSAFDS